MPVETTFRLTLAASLLPSLCFAVPYVWPELKDRRGWQTADCVIGPSSLHGIRLEGTTIQGMGQVQV